jgi:hypothetical protein
MASAPSQRHSSPPEQTTSSAPTLRHDDDSDGSDAQSTRGVPTTQSLQDGARRPEARSPRVLEDDANAAPCFDPSFVPPDQNQAEPRHCWICLDDEGDDAERLSEWRSPCKCRLQAHEECLLEWIADLEAPKHGGPRLVEICCPQCKGEIQVAPSRDYIVLAVDIVRDIIGLLSLPAQISALVGCLASSSLIYGLNAVHLVFGTEDTMKLLRIGAIGQVGPGALQRYGKSWLDKLLWVMPYTDPFTPSNYLVGWGPFALALPLVAPALALSRTRHADAISMVIPIPVSQCPQHTKMLNFCMLTLICSIFYTESSTGV